ncbi:MAG: type VI secretion system tube protein TssD [bacterium]
MKKAVQLVQARVAKSLGVLLSVALAITAVTLFGAAEPILRRMEIGGPAAAGTGISATMQGTKQGAFKGDDPSGKIPVAGFNYEVTSPRDAATGMATGKRQHKPITIIKEWGAASPLIFKALVNNEVLSKVAFEFSRINPQGQNEVYYTITLTNAMVSSIKQSCPQAAGGGKCTAPVEEVSFTFQKIEMENKIAKTMAVDDWSAPVG